jgi:hypothetical protein
MSKVPFLGGSGGGKGVVPAKPTLLHTATGEFTITNYDASLTYTLSSGSRTNDKVTLPSADQSATVTAKSPKGLVNSPATYIERKAKTTYAKTEYVGTNWYTHGFPCHSSNVGGCPESGRIGACSWYPPNSSCGHSDGYTYCSYPYNPAPPGFNDQYGEWSYVS